MNSSNKVVEEGDMANSSVLALVGKHAPTDHRPSKRSTMVRRFRRKTFFFILNEPIAGTRRQACKNTHANIRRSDCVGPKLSNSERPNLIPYIYIYILNHHFYFPAQLVGGFTLSDLLYKPWSQVSSLLLPGTCLHFYRA